MALVLLFSSSAGDAAQMGVGFPRSSLGRSRPDLVACLVKMHSTRVRWVIVPEVVRSYGRSARENKSPAWRIDHSWDNWADPARLSASVPIMAFTIENFILRRPYIYHLTARSNAARIKEFAALEPAAAILKASGNHKLLGSQGGDYRFKLASTPNPSMYAISSPSTWVPSIFRAAGQSRTWFGS